MKHSLQAAAVRESPRYVDGTLENIGKLVNLLKPFARVPEHREILCQVEEVCDLRTPGAEQRAFAQLSPGAGEVCQLAQYGAHWRKGGRKWRKSCSAMCLLS